MEEIGFERFLELLRGYSSALNCENYMSLIEEGDNTRTRYFYGRQCAISQWIFEYGKKTNVYIDIFETSSDADTDSVIEYWVARCKNLEKEFACPSIQLNAYIVCNTVPKNLEDNIGSRVYTRLGWRFPTDERVKQLSSNDFEAVKLLCNIENSNDTNYGVRLSSSILGSFEEIVINGNNIYSDEDRCYGIFEGGELCGAAICAYIEPLNIALLATVFISNMHRKKGLAKSLVGNALSRYPNAKWVYQVDKDNYPSVALAKSLGFSLEGARVLIYRKETH